MQDISRLIKGGKEGRELEEDGSKQQVAGNLGKEGNEK